MALDERPADRMMRLSGVPRAAEGTYGGGIAFVAYCLGGEVRAQQRRDAIGRAYAAHRRVMNRSEDPYATALILCQRLGVALEDLARLMLALESLGNRDVFARLRDVSSSDLDDVFSRLRDDPEALRAAVRLPSVDDAAGLEPPLQEAVLEASEALTQRWIGHWNRCADGWQLLRRLAKALRHGSPVLPRELVLGPPGAGALGQELTDTYDRWVLLVGTEVDHEAAALNTTYAMADISEDTLARARQAGLEAVGLARDLAAGHVHRVRSESKWAMPDDVIRLVGREHRRVLRDYART